MADGRPPHGADGLAAGEPAQLLYTLETRLAPALEAAAAAVRDAERALAQAQERLTHAELAADTPYASDPLTFMRRSVDEEVEALARKTNEKKVKVSYRFLLERAVELATAEVARYHEDQATAQAELVDGLDACRAAESRAAEALQAARQMQERVRAAEQSARQGLRLLLEKLQASPT